MKHLLPSAGILASIIFAVPMNAQQNNCAGAGNATLEFRLDNNTPLGAGSSGVINVIGPASTCYWLVCDIERGNGAVFHPIFGSAHLCIPLGPNYVNLLDACLDSSGTLSIPFRIPYGFTSRLELCCQWAGIDPTTFEITSSNLVCICANTPQCEDIEHFSHMTCFQSPAAFPVVVSSEAEGDKVSVSFDPSNPPTFPITKGIVSIEKISNFHGELCVFSRVNAGAGNKLSSNTDVEVIAGGTKHSQSIHTSCSKPISAGMQFGDFLITDLFDPVGCGDPCIGGLNCLGYCATVDAPAAYPATVTSRVSESKGSGASEASVSYDPNNPPSFPVKSKDGKVSILSISVVGNKLEVCSLAENGTDSKGKLNKFPSSNMLFHTSAGGNKTEQVIHVSCSKPIRVGSKFGDYEINRLCSVKPCEGGLNILGLRAEFDIPTSFPANIEVVISEDGKNPDKVSVAYDPNSPPSFPVFSSKGTTLIDNIKMVGGKLRVVFFGDNGRSSKGEFNKFPSNDMKFSASDGITTHSAVIHTSCSQPIVLGAKHGELTIVGFRSAK